MPQPVMSEPNNENSTARLANKFQPGKLLAILTAGLVVGIIAASVAISFAALVFSGELAGFVSRGIGLFLLSSLVATIVTGFISSYPGIIAINQDVPAAIIAVVAAGIVASMSATATPAKMYLTVVAAIIIVAAMLGAILYFGPNTLSWTSKMIFGSLLMLLGLSFLDDGEEIGFYLNQPRTAAVVTDESSTIYRLSIQSLKQMEQNDPEAAFTFHQAIIRLVSERLTHLINTANALQR